MSRPVSWVLTCDFAQVCDVIELLVAEQVVGREPCLKQVRFTWPVKVYAAFPDPICSPWHGIGLPHAAGDSSALLCHLDRHVLADGAAAAVPRHVFPARLSRGTRASRMGGVGRNYCPRKGRQTISVFVSCLLIRISADSLPCQPCRSSCCGSCFRAKRRQWPDSCALHPFLCAELRVS